MAIQRPVSPYAVNRRNSQHAPFPGSGARVQNAALGGALSADAGSNAAASGEIPRVVHPPGVPEAQPIGVPVRAPEAPSAPSAPTAPSSPSSAAASTASPYAGRPGYDAIARAYQNYLGRPGSDGEILSHLNGGQWLDQASSPGLNSSIASIYNSPEANTFRGRPAPSAASTATAAATDGVYGVGGGAWGSNYEWQGGPDGPKVSDLFAKVGDSSRLTGFNTAGWGTGERGTESSKNAFGMIASRYDPRDDSSLDRMLADPDFQAFYPGAKKVGVDKIDFGDGIAVDVWRNHVPGQGGDAWAYQPPGGSAPAAAPSAAPQAGIATPLAGLSTADPNQPDFYPRLLATLLQQLEI
jgi:hypothetical protein